MDFRDYPTRDLNEQDFDQIFQKNKNLMLVGDHGCGKTQRVLDCFERNLKSDENWLYFSGATMDPWIDFIGIPKEGEDGSLKFLRPPRVNEKVEAIFIDEFNRAEKEVRNGCMELLQFKSVNGVSLPNLKVVWTAINPPIDEDKDYTEAFDYSVEEMDPAQIDRFHVIINIPSQPIKSWFSKKYGEKGEVMVDWWRSQAKKFKRGCSSRRLEYAMTAYKDGTPLNFVLPNTGNIKQLLIDLNTDPFKKVMIELEESPSVDLYKKMVSFNNIEAIKESFDNKKLYSYAYLAPSDIFSDVYFTNESFRKRANVFSFSHHHPKWARRIKEIEKAHPNKSEIKELKKVRSLAKINPDFWNSKSETGTEINFNEWRNRNLDKESSLDLTQNRDCFLRWVCCEVGCELGVEIDNLKGEEHFLVWLESLSRYQKGSICGGFRKKAFGILSNKVSPDIISKLSRNTVKKFEEFGYKFKRINQGSSCDNISSLVKKYEELLVIAES